MWVYGGSIEKVTIWQTEYQHAVQWALSEQNVIMWVPHGDGSTNGWPHKKNLVFLMFLPAK